MKLEIVPCYTCIVRSVCDGYNCDKISWFDISKCYNLREDFIREFKDKVIWYWISRNQTLSEDFIREFQNVVRWKWIFDCQKL